MTGEWVAADRNCLKDKRVLLVIAGVDVGRAIVAGFQDCGARIAVLTDNRELLTGLPATVTSIEVQFGSREQVEEAFESGIANLGVPDLVVLSALPLCAVRVKALVDQTDAEWLGGPREAIRTTLYCLQAAGKYLKIGGGAVAIIGPSLALAGCSGLVGLTAALEGQRGLMKSVARQWGAAGVSLNWVACAPKTLSSIFDAAPLAAKADAVPVALGQALDMRTQVVPVLGFLASPAGRVITGSTLTLDGGEWMLP